MALLMLLSWREGRGVGGGWRKRQEESYHWAVQSPQVFSQKTDVMSKSLSHPELNTEPDESETRVADMLQENDRNGIARRVNTHTHTKWRPRGL